MTCCGKPMRLDGGMWVCRKCGSSFQGVVQGRRVVATGLIARRTRGRSLRVTCTAAGVTGHLRRTTTPAAAGGGR